MAVAHATNDDKLVRCYAGRPNPAMDSALTAGTMVCSPICEPPTRSRFRVSAASLGGTAELDWPANSSLTVGPPFRNNPVV